MPRGGGVIVVLASGGTIAGTAASAAAHTGYRAGALGVAELLAAVPPLAGQAIEAETVAQMDSCDMDHATWAALAIRVRFHLARAEVAGVVLTHGTDTLEETAFFLQRTVAAVKPVVLTAAMRPATALSPDGPQNLFDAVSVARAPGARGVLAVLGGRIIGAGDLRKVHGYRVDAFDAGDAGALGLLADGELQLHRAWPEPDGRAAVVLDRPPQSWPRVAVVLSHAGVEATLLDAAVAAGLDGVVIAGTGNGTVHARLLEAARRAELAGLTVWRASRCWLGGVVGDGGPVPAAGALTPVQARVALMLELASRG
ncbi:MAG: asparaginase [Rubrivivax sp.]|nr:asparaginase [Rubrivivax sp.]